MACAGRFKCDKCRQAVWAALLYFLVLAASVLVNIFLIWQLLPEDVAHWDVVEGSDYAEVSCAVLFWPITRCTALLEEHMGFTLMGWAVLVSDVGLCCASVLPQWPNIEQVTRSAGLPQLSCSQYRLHCGHPIL